MDSKNIIDNKKLTNIITCNIYDDKEKKNVKQQKILLNDDLIIILNGYREIPIKKFIYYVLCIGTLGIFYLILHWFPKLKLKIIGTTVPITNASELFIENSWSNNVTHVKVRRNAFNGKISDIFPKYSDKNRKQFNQCNITNSQFENANITHNFELKYFIYQYIRFVFNPITLEYEQIINWKDPNWDSIKSTSNGIESVEIYTQRKKIFGQNIAQITQKSTLSFLLDEVLHPFYIFQICSIIIWCSEEYYYYAFCIFVMSVFSTLSTLKTSKKNLKKISEMSKFTCPVVVIRKDGIGDQQKEDEGSIFKHIDSSDLVPGDVMVIAPNELKVFPCDAILLKGDCIVNESMLTGESMPVNKIPIKNEELLNLNFENEDIVNSLGNNCFFAGTSIVRVRGDKNNNISSSSKTLVDKNNENYINDPKKRKSNLKYETKSAYALVIRTGFNTAKGSLVRSMLFPKQNFFKFYRDSFYFVFVLAIIAFLGFGGTLYTLIKYGVPFSIIIIRALDLITVVVPPALPATMSIGTNFAISKLKKLNIFCISPNHVIVGGKLNLICFDKTGTLTENGLCVYGVHHIERNNDTSSEKLLSRSPSTNSNSTLKENTNVKFSDLVNHKSKNQDFFSSTYSNIIMDSPIITSNQNENEASLLISKRYMDLLRYAMATCHNLKVVDGQLIGDPLDIEMFKFIDWSIQEKEGSVDGLSTIIRPKINPNNDNKDKNDMKINIETQKSYQSLDKFITDNNIAEVDSSKDLFELGILKVFEFSSHLRRMSVIIRRMYSQENNINVSDSLEVFVKGAPEVICSICRKDTVPSNFNQELHHLVNKGYRVIAVGYKTLENIKYHKLMKMERNEIESNLEFLGFIIFENPLKPGTKKTIEELNNANIQSYMCTGDNILTGISVARECSMIDKDAKVKILKFVENTGEVDANTPPEIIYGGRTPDAQIYLEELNTNKVNSDKQQPNINGELNNSDDDNEIELSSISGSTLSETTSNYKNNILTKESVINIDNDCFAMTGDVFDWVLHNYSEDQLFSVLENCKVFARMLPDQKKLLVEKFQEMGHCVSFCGDGANDCGALKSADVGLSLSEAEASVAAPFTSRDMDLKCVLDVIKEGRAALVTNFSCFKYMAIYSIIQFTTVSLLYYLAANLGDAQFLFIDLFLILPIAISMARSKTYHKIHPKAPSANLISQKVLVSLIGQIIIQMLFQFYMFFWTKRQSWYEEPEDNDGETVLCCENTILFYVSSFQYLIGAFVFNVGPPYRQSFYKNFWFMLCSALLSIFLVVMIFLPENAFLEFMELMVIPNSARIYTLIIIALNAIVSVLAERYLWQRIISLFKKIRKTK